MIRRVMIRWMVMLGLVGITATAWAQRAPDWRISDNDGDVADITSGGNLQITQTNTAGTGRAAAAPDVRITDADQTVATITTNGALNVTWT